MAIIQIGTVEGLQGEVSVVHPDGTAEPLNSGSAVYADDTVITAQDGAATIRFSDGTLYSVGPDFTARLNSELFDADGFVRQDLSATGGDVAQILALELDRSGLQHYLHRRRVHDPELEHGKRRQLGGSGGRDLQRQTNHPDRGVDQPGPRGAPGVHRQHIEDPGVKS